MSNLASMYKKSEVDQFVRAFGLLFGGIAYHGSMADPSVRHSTERNPRFLINYSGNGFRQDLWDNDGFGNVHHYVAFVVAGYQTSAPFAATVNTVREHGANDADVRIGNIAAEHGSEMQSIAQLQRSQPRLSLRGPMYLSALIDRDL